VSSSLRVRSYVIGESQMLGMFRRYADGDFVRVPRLNEVPDNATIERVFHDAYRRGFVFMVSHESFDLVDCHVEPPILPGSLSEFVFRIVREPTTPARENTPW
jgi:hypothetical protein